MTDRAESSRDRRAAIEEILRGEEIHNQLELRRKLRKKGFRVTQPSVSRDLAELQVIKVGGRYLPGDALVQGASPVDELEAVAEFILSGPRPAGPYMLVVKTPAGVASRVALAIDHARWPDVVGTVAGDDTLFIATSGRRAQAQLTAALGRSMREKAHA